MGLEAVVGEIRVKGQKEAETIREQTRKEVERILIRAGESSEDQGFLLKNQLINRYAISRARKFLRPTCW